MTWAMVPSVCGWIGGRALRRKWQPTPGCLPGEPHRQRSLVGYSPWGRKESDTTSQLSTWAEGRAQKKGSFAWLIEQETLQGTLMQKNVSQQHPSDALLLFMNSAEPSWKSSNRISLTAGGPPRIGDRQGCHSS